MKSTVDQCGHFMLHTLMSMKAAFVMARHFDKFDKAAHDFDLENARLKDELQTTYAKLRTEELNGAKLAAKVRDLTGEVGELKEMNQTIRDDLTRSSDSKDRLAEKVEKLEGELSVSKVEIAIERFVQSDEMTHRTGVEIATCLSSFDQSYEEELPTLPDCLADFKASANLKQEWFDQIPDSPDT